jgi:ribosomal protein S18
VSKGKILSPLFTGLTAKEQRHIATAIKTARVAGLLPFINQ